MALAIVSPISESACSASRQLVYAPEVACDATLTCVQSEQRMHGPEILLTAAEIVVTVVNCYVRSAQRHLTVAVVSHNYVSSVIGHQLQYITAGFVKSRLLHSAHSPNSYLVE